MTWKKKKAFVTLLMLLFFGICLGLGIFLGYSIVENFGTEHAWWYLVGRLFEGFVLIFLAFILQVIVHETGHLFAGLMRGWQFRTFMIFGVVLSRRDGKFHLSRFAIPGAGGQCLMSPPEKGDTDAGITLYNAGGILMNLLVALLCLCVYFLGGDAIVWEANVLLVSLSVIGLLFFLINGIPLGGNLPNDGENMLNLRKDPFSTHVFLTTMRVLGGMMQGTTLDAMLKTYLCDGVTLDFSNPIHVMAVNFDLSAAVVRLDLEKAHALVRTIDREFDKIIPIYQKEILFEKVFLYLVAPVEGVDVKELLDKDTLKYFEMQSAFRPTALRVKYAYARLYEKDEEKAAKIYKQFTKVCSRYHVRGEVVMEQKLVEYVREMHVLI